MLNNIDKSDKEKIPAGLEKIFFGMGCFWGAEKVFWSIPGIYLTSVGYAGGHTDNPNYEEVCSGNTNHAEVVKIVYNPKIIELNKILIYFWENHDPTQGMRQGNDFGSQYRSLIMTTDDKQTQEALRTKKEYELTLLKNGFNKITTEIIRFDKFFCAEEYHQKYLHKNPRGYCGLGGTNIKFELLI